jgi:DNA-binding NtrC family response regulator
VDRARRIFVVDDEKIIADTLTAILNARGYQASAFYTAGTVLQVALDSRPDLLITDVALDPDSINGIDLATYLERIYPDLRVLLVSGHIGTGELLQQAQREGHDFPLLSKPVPPEELLRMVAELVSDLAQGQTR